MLSKLDLNKDKFDNIKPEILSFSLYLQRNPSYKGRKYSQKMARKLEELFQRFHGRKTKHYVIIKIKRTLSIDNVHMLE